ncbi:MAG: D-glucuronyl C5-epimerase family protein [Bacteroidales bacterium]|jgi:heparosan-N-sulfate-glucuronate 5-epimerase|nr:D-glucuronyl C5-epimerase family protein [Bacteroidales bacterium]
MLKNFIFGILLFFNLIGFSQLNLARPYPFTKGYTYSLKIDNVSEIPKFELHGDSVYYPIQYGRYAVELYRGYYDSRDTAYLSKFLVFANFIKNQFTDYGKFGVWLCEGNYPSYNLIKPWPSAMAQGYCISAMYSAYTITNNEKFMEIAVKALESFSVSVEEGGVVSDINGMVFYEEYPGLPSKHVLNGFIFSLAGLFNFYENTGNKKAFKYFLDGVNSLENLLEEFDTGYASLYLLDGKNNLATAKKGDKYHEIHIGQLAWLYKVTGKDQFKFYAEKFLAYDLGSNRFSHEGKILKIVTNYSIDSVRYGVNNIYDGNWTYGRYWSSHKYPVELSIAFNEKKRDITEIVLFYEKSSVNVDSMYIEYVNSEGGTEKVNTITQSNIKHNNNWTYKDYGVRIIVYEIPNPIKEANGIKLHLYGKSGNIVKLNEINFHNNCEYSIERLLNSDKW